MSTQWGDCQVPERPDADWEPSADEPPPFEEAHDQMPIPERGMSQTSGVNPSLYDGVKKSKPSRKGGKKR